MISILAILAFGLLVITPFGMIRAHRARAGWRTWSPLMAVAFTFVVSFLVGVTLSIFPRSHTETFLAWFQVVGSSMIMLPGALGLVLFFRYQPVESDLKQSRA